MTHTSTIQKYDEIGIELFAPQDETDIYTYDNLDKQLQDDNIDSEQEAFMRGYLAA